VGLSARDTTGETKMSNSIRFEVKTGRTTIFVPATIDEYNLIFSGKYGEPPRSIDVRLNATPIMTLTGAMPWRMAMELLATIDLWRRRER